MKKKLMISLIVIGAVITVLLCIKHNLEVKCEYSLEMTDLQGMRNAELSAMMIWKDKLPERTIEYWYNANEFAIVPTEEEMPAPCGLGTSIRGGAIKDFEIETGKAYSYDENEDYRDKVIHVVVDSKDRNLDIRIDWVKSE